MTPCAHISTYKAEKHVVTDICDVLWDSIENALANQRYCLVLSIHLFIYLFIKRYEYMNFTLAFISLQNVSSE